jgi:spermidine/putrescine ABC transporter ATP-binding subunit
MFETIVSVRNLTRRFPGGVTAVDGVSVDIAQNEFFALLGPSGCGKTTLLRMISGLDQPDEGQILIDGEDMAFTPPNKRPTNMVFQSYAVFPHMSVADNVAYGLRVTGVKESEVQARVKEGLAMVKLSELATRKPDQLSGGQRQRVALARALVKRPKVLLLDEPLSALDAKLRDEMRLELTRLQKAVGITFIFVTHDQDEALSMASRIAVMDKGIICQIASPKTLYENPANRFVASFIGKVNCFDATVTSQNGKTVLCDVRNIGKIDIQSDKTCAGSVTIAIRPEKLRIAKSEPKGQGSIRLKSVLRDIAYFGDWSEYIVAADGNRQLSVNVPNNTNDPATDIVIGDSVWIHWQTSDSLLLTE